jgi:hypothetical protein
VKKITCKDLKIVNCCYFCSNDSPRPRNCFLQELENIGIFKKHILIKNHFIYLASRQWIDDYPKIYIEYVRQQYPEYFASLEKILLLK